MTTHCTRCDGTGFLNVQQLPDKVRAEFDKTGAHATISRWILANTNHDVQVCDCCGDGEQWHGTPGEHYGPDDPRGRHGPYAYNGGLCECH